MSDNQCCENVQEQVLSHTARDTGTLENVWHCLKFNITIPYDQVLFLNPHLPCPPPLWKPSDCSLYQWVCFYFVLFFNLHA